MNGYQSNPWGGGFSRTSPFGGTPVFGGAFSGFGGAQPRMGMALAQMAQGDDPFVPSVTPRTSQGPGGPMSPPNLTPAAMPTMPAAASGGMGGAQGLGQKLLGVLGGNNGANGLMLGQMLLGVVENERNRREYNRQTKRQEQAEDEQRDRYDSWSPQRQEIIDRYRSRIGG